MYFNEIEPYAAQWIRNLYPDDDVTVDERSIVDVMPEDVVMAIMRCARCAQVFWEHVERIAKRFGKP